MEESSDIMCCCANCGRAGVDDIKLKICTACRLVKYCSVDCQKEHRSKHKKACKKRVAELRDEILFKQPESSYLGEILFRQPESSYLGDCHLCCLPLPLDQNKFAVNTCCSKLFCKGCGYANHLRERREGLEPKCPFCREPVPKIDEEHDQRLMKRIAANDPVALCQKGGKCCDEEDYAGAFEYFTKAAELGDIKAHYNLSLLYQNGQGVERDKKKELHHLEVAAI